MIVTRSLRTLSFVAKRGGEQSDQKWAIQKVRNQKSHITAKGKEAGGEFRNLKHLTPFMTMR